MENNFFCLDLGNYLHFNICFIIVSKNKTTTWPCGLSRYQVQTVMVFLESIGSVYLQEICYWLYWITRYKKQWLIIEAAPISGDRSMLSLKEWAWKHANPFDLHLTFPRQVYTSLKMKGKMPFRCWDRGRLFYSLTRVATHTLKLYKDIVYLSVYRSI